MSRRSRATTPEFTLTDTGPLEGVINANDPYHSQARSALGRLPRVPLLTTWPCFTETMYLIHQAGGHAAQDELWGYLADGLVRLHVPSQAEQRRMRELRAIYRDAPMDLADASVVAAAEALPVQRKHCPFSGSLLLANISTPIERRMAVYWKCFPDTARLVEIIEARGLVGNQDGVKPHETLVRPEHIDAFAGRQAGGTGH